MLFLHSLVHYSYFYPLFLFSALTADFISLQDLFAQSLEHPAFVCFHTRLIEGVDPEDLAGNVAGKLEEVKQPRCPQDPGRSPTG